MTDADDAERLWEPPLDGSEVDTLLGSLERQRRTFRWKTGNLDAAGLAARLGPSEVTLGGLLKHLALMEDLNFSNFLQDRPLRPPWAGIDRDANPDWEWHSAASDSPVELRSLWLDAVERSRSAIKAALDEGGPGQLSRRTLDGGVRASVRRVLVDLIEEYARHNGQADLIRESIDGLVGEDPPR